MSSIAKACSRCYRLKVKCKPVDDCDESGCQRCRSARMICTPRPTLSSSSSDGQRNGPHKQETVEKLANKVAELCENVAALQARNGQYSKLYRDFTEIELYALFDHYRSTMADGYPLATKADLMDISVVKADRPLFFRAACCAAVASTDGDLCLALVKENYKYLCEISLSDTPASIDMLQALYVTAIYFPYADPGIFRTMMGASSMAFQTLQELQFLGMPKQTSLEFERCRLAVYFLCNSSRLWQKNDFRLISWNASHDAAVALLENGDDCDRALAESIRYMRIAEGISFLSSPDFSTEDIFRQYLSIFQASPLPSAMPPIDFSNTMVPLFKLMNCLPLIDRYLDLFKEGDTTVNVTLCFEAIIREGQAILDHLRRVRDSHLRFPTFFYLRALRSVLSIAYFCRTWGHDYYEQLIIELRPLYDQIVEKLPFLQRTRPFLEGVDAWYRNYDPLNTENSLVEVLDRFAPGRK